MKDPKEKAKKTAQLFFVGLLSALLICIILLKLAERKFKDYYDINTVKINTLKKQ